MKGHRTVLQFFAFTLAALSIAFCLRLGAETPTARTATSWTSSRGQFGVVTITVSSVLESVGPLSYGPKNLYDRDPSTAWVEGARGHGIGECVTFRFENPMAFRHFWIVNGYAKSGDLFRKNGRVRELLVEAAGGVKYNFTLEDSMRQQTLTLPRVVESSWVKFTIQSVYPGEAYSDTAISELTVDLESENYRSVEQPASPQRAANALSGTYVVLTEGGGGIALTFAENGNFTSVALNPRGDKRKHYGKGNYTISGSMVTLATSDGWSGRMMLDRNGDLFDQPNNLRFKRLK